MAKRQTGQPKPGGKRNQEGDLQGGPGRAYPDPLSRLPERVDQGRIKAEEVEHRHLGESGEGNQVAGIKLIADPQPDEPPIAPQHGGEDQQVDPDIQLRNLNHPVPERVRPDPRPEIHQPRPRPSPVQGTGYHRGKLE